MLAPSQHLHGRRGTVELEIEPRLVVVGDTIVDGGIFGTGDVLDLAEIQGIPHIIPIGIDGGFHGIAAQGDVHLGDSGRMRLDRLRRNAEEQERQGRQDPGFDATGFQRAKKFRGSLHLPHFPRIPRSPLAGISRDLDPVPMNFLRSGRFSVPDIPNRRGPRPVGSDPRPWPAGTAARWPSARFPARPGPGPPAAPDSRPRRPRRAPRDRP